MVALQCQYVPDPSCLPQSINLKVQGETLWSTRPSSRPVSGGGGSKEHTLLLSRALLLITHWPKLGRLSLLTSKGGWRMYISVKYAQLKFRVLMGSMKKKSKLLLPIKKRRSGIWRQAMVSDTGYCVIWFRFKGRWRAGQTPTSPSGPMRIWQFCDNLYSSVVNSSLEGMLASQNSVQGLVDHDYFQLWMNEKS